MENCVDFVLNFEEVMSILTDTTNAPISAFIGGRWKSANLLSESLKDIFENAYEWDFTNQNEAAMKNVPFLEWDTQNSTWIFKEVFINFINYLFKEYGHSYCATSKDDTAASLVNCAISFLDDLMNKAFETYSKYEQLFTYYNDLKGKLLEGVKSKNKAKNASKYKDTPQNSVTLENLGDGFNSNVTVYESENDFEDGRDTPVARLNEIEMKLSNLYGQWAYDFRVFFWEA